jgi:hypothetical protein
MAPRVPADPLRAEDHGLSIDSAETARQVARGHSELLGGQRGKGAPDA